MTKVSDSYRFPSVILVHIVTVNILSLSLYNMKAYNQRLLLLSVICIHLNVHASTEAEEIELFFRVSDTTHRETAPLPQGVNETRSVT